MWTMWVIGYDFYSPAEGPCWLVVLWEVLWGGDGLPRMLIVCHSFREHNIVVLGEDTNLSLYSIAAGVLYFWGIAIVFATLYWERKELHLSFPPLRIIEICKI